MNTVKRIFIIGHPGAGKALAGKTLAEKLGWRFIDADLGLESRVGQSLNEILGKQGEKSFHDCQDKILANLLNQENVVINTDPGIVCNEINRNFLASEFSVYIQANTPIQLERTSRNPAPLLPVANLNEFYDKLHAERDHIYDQTATLAINSNTGTLDEHVEIILKHASVKHKDVESSLDKNDIVFFHKTRHVPVHIPKQQAICLKLLAQGKSSKEIAQEIGLSHRTVEGYLAKTMESLGCTSSKELITLYHDQP